jgi:hypothetical protein
MYPLSAEEDLPMVKKFSKDVNQELDDISPMKASYEGQEDQLILL